MAGAHGLHARPAAAVVRAAADAQAEVRIRNLTTGAGPAPARSLTALGVPSARSRATRVRRGGARRPGAAETAAAIAALIGAAERRRARRPPRRPPPAAAAARAAALGAWPRRPGGRSGPRGRSAAPAARPAAEPSGDPGAERAALGAALTAVGGRLAALAGDRRPRDRRHPRRPGPDSSATTSWSGAAQAAIDAGRSAAAGVARRRRGGRGRLRRPGRRVPARPRRRPARPGAAGGRAARRRRRAGGRRSRPCWWPTTSARRRWPRLDPAPGAGPGHGGRRPHLARVDHRPRARHPGGRGPRAGGPGRRRGTTLIVDGDAGTVDVGARRGGGRRPRGARPRGRRAARRGPASGRASRRSRPTDGTWRWPPTSAAPATRARPSRRAPTGWACCAASSCSSTAPSRRREDEQARPTRRRSGRSAAGAWWSGRSTPAPTSRCATCRPPPRPTRSSGVRGLRLALQHPDALRTQLRAVLRAAAAGPIGIMFPMVSEVDELRARAAALERGARGPRRRGRDVPAVEVGAMVEVPGRRGAWRRSSPRRRTSCRWAPTTSSST